MSSRRSKGYVVAAQKLKSRLGRFLREVRKGRTIVITDRGEPVAEIRPVTLRDAGREGELDRLVTLGRLTRTSKKPLSPFRPIRSNGRPASEAIVEHREDRF